MKFDVILTNPPFQDTVNRNKTPHKLWIDFTLAVFDRMLADGGDLLQVSPSSFSSPSNIVLSLMEEYETIVLRMGTERHFPTVGSTFADYWIRKRAASTSPTRASINGEEFDLLLDKSMAYIPNDASRLSLSIHQKVMFSDRLRLQVEWDYVAAHNIRRRDANPSLSETKSERHKYPVFHTNRSTWWSSLRQPWADEKKVMWTRSGYTKPFFDPGVLGGTDMVYFVRVGSVDEGTRLAEYLNSDLLHYIYKTAKWSGFGNERVFAGLPRPPQDKVMSNEAIYSYFNLTEEEIEHVRATLGPRRGTP